MVIIVVAVEEVSMLTVSRPAAVAAGAVLAAQAITAVPAAAAPVGCGFGRGGPFDSTICWLDMSGFDQRRAEGGGGQPMTVRITSTYSISFVVKVRPGPNGVRRLEPTAFPTYTGTPVGNAYYVGAPGRPALYQQVGTAYGDQGTVVLDDIKVTGPAGQPLDGYGFVAADAETTNRDEALVFSSDKPLKGGSSSRRATPSPARPS
ncbi:CshA/CshB family fibrillar adhesin-related protein [Spirillospora sp. NPDC050679]